ncbi:submandibular glandular kallikrein-9-like [Hermetia illucens]|uniref:submandibular glandular kallikrein-9-like n=1 Tax=Hermetia illucens TaxID=343691 RepID=UPI0018CC42F4|nr:submandibular glandular kallikrein-9-like [Hermetia illucens]
MCIHTFRHNILQIVVVFLILICYSCATIEECTDGEYPSAAAIVNTVNRLSSCSGAIISPKFVVTVRHCMLLTTNPEELRVIAGSNRLDKNSTKAFLVRKVTGVVAYPTKGKALDDITLIQVSFPFFFNKNTNKTVPSTIGPVFGQKCTLIGWGLSAEGSPINIKQKQTLYMTNCPNINKTDEIICGVLTSDEPEHCVGDSGGPLYCDGHLSALLLGGACRAPGKFVIFINIINYNKWIKENMKYDFKNVLTGWFSVANRLKISPFCSVFIVLSISYVRTFKKYI